MHWSHCCSKFNYISAPKDRQENSKSKNHSFFLNLSKFDLPFDFIQNDQDTYFVRAGLYDFNYKEFLGKQWNSTKIRSYKKLNDVITLELNEAIYFHTSLIDESLVVIFEIIRYKSEEEQSSVGWSIFDLFKSSNKPSEKITIGIIKGTPRALMLMDDLPERYPALQKYDKAFIHLTFNTNQAFDSYQYLVPENFLLHDNDKLPGLETSAGGKTNYLNPMISKFTNYSIDKLKVVIEPSLFEFENNLKKLLSFDRLNRDNSGQNKDAGSLKIVERRLRVGVHNGYTFVEDNDTVCLNVHDSMVKSSRTSHSVKSTSTDNNALKAKNAVEVSLPSDPNFALIFFLEYVVAESKFEESRRMSTSMSPAAQHTYQICWAVYQPFNQQIAAISFVDGIKLELELNGGSKDAPEDVLVYRSESLNNAGDYSSNGIKLSAVFRTKVDKEDEQMIVVQKRALAYSGIPSESKTLPEEVPQLKPQIKDSNSIMNSQNQSMVSDIYDTQIRQHQQFLMQQQMQQQWYDQRSFQMSPIFMGKRAMSPNETIGNYTDIEPYVISPDSQSVVRGRAGNMQPLQMRSHAGLGLSRATYANLYAAGFQEFVDSAGNHPTVIEPSQSPDEINWLLEERDSKDCDEIIFQFMALSRYDVMITNNQAKSVFFTFQFYRFPHVATERLKLDNIIDNISNYVEAAPKILRKINKDGSVSGDAPGAVVKYMLNPTFMKHGDRYSYLEYMSQQVMYIDVWDGDSLMLIGTSSVHLKNMCRQGKSSVQMTYELDIINQAEIDEGDKSTIKGRLHLRMINLGSTSTDKIKNMTLTAHPRKGLLVDASEIEGFSGGSMSTNSYKLSGSLKNIYKTEDIDGNRIGYSGVVVRPQPAAAKHRELAELLDNRSGPRGCGTISPSKTPLMNESVLKGMDRDKTKKLSRLKSLLETLPSNYDKSEDNSLILEANRNDKVEKIKNLQIINTFRAKQKKENIRMMLTGVVQREVTLYPKFGSTEIFEVKIKNLYNVDDNIQIEIMDDSNSLDIIHNPSELRALKSLYSITTASIDGLISTNKQKGCTEVFMRAKEVSLIPFKYTNITIQTSQMVQEPMVERNSGAQQNCMSVPDIEKQIIFRTSDGKLISMIRLKIFPQPPAIDQTFRFFHPELSFLKKLISLPPFRVNAGPNDAVKPLTRCSDPEVITECQQSPVGSPQDVFVKVNCGPCPQTRQFLLAVYLDKFLLNPIQLWHFTIHSQKRIDIVAFQGQTNHLSLLVKGTSNSHRVQVFSSHPHELSVGQMDANNFTLVAHSTCELNLSLTPLKIGNRTFHVNVVDIDTYKLVAAWSICAICKEPEVSKMFELEISANGGDECRKKIGFQNPYGYDKRFFIITDRQDLIMFKDTILQIGPNKVEHIGILFLPVINRGRQKIFVFINDEDGRNEETFSLLVNYV